MVEEALAFEVCVVMVEWAGVPLTWGSSLAVGKGQSGSERTGDVWPEEH